MTRIKDLWKNGKRALALMLVLVLTLTLLPETKSLASRQYQTVESPTSGYAADPPDAAQLDDELQNRTGHYRKFRDFMSDTDEHDEEAFTKWESTTALPTKAGYYFLMDDVVLTEPWIVSKNIQLCLNGHNIEGDFSRAVIYINDGGILTLWDSLQTPGEIRHTKEDSIGPGVYVRQGGTFRMHGGCITDNNNEGIGAGGGSGGGVHVKGTFEMLGGWITGNKAYRGGGVFVNGGTFTMTDGHIKGNVASGNKKKTSEELAAENEEVTETTVAAAPEQIPAGSEELDTHTRAIETIIEDEDAVVDDGVIDPEDLDGGGGVYNLNGIVKLTGGYIHANRTSANGGGLFGNCYTAGENQLEGAPYIYQNAGAGVLEDVYLRGYKDRDKLHITGKLSENSYIGVSVTDGPFTVDWGKYMGEGNLIQNYFVSNLSGVYLEEKYMEVQAASSTTIGGITYDYWDSTSGLPTESGNYTLMKDVTLKEIWQLQGKVTIGLDLNGHTVTMDNNGTLGSVGAGCILDLFDYSDAKTGKMTHRAGAYGEGFVVQSGASFHLHDGSITGHSTLQGDANGAGVVVYGSFVMSGGTVTKNTALRGAGVYVEGENASFTLTGGEISENQATGTSNGTDNIYDGGAGVYLHSGTANISGGTVKDNLANGSGGGIFVVFADGQLASKVNLYGNPVVSGNFAAGKSDNVYFLPKGAGIFTIADELTEGASIGVRNTNVNVTDGWYEIMQSADPAEFFVGDETGYDPKMRDGEVRMLKAGREYRNILFEEWASGNSLPAVTGNYYLSQDVEISGTWNVPAGTSINLDLGGKNITLSGSGDVVNVAGELNLYDSTESNTGKLTRADGTNGRGILVAQTGVCRLYGGSVAGNKTSENGGGVRVQGQFELNGGRVYMNEGASGGGVYVEASGAFQMTDGDVIGNNASGNGGGVATSSGSLDFSGGQMISNTANGNGGGVWFSGSAGSGALRVQGKPRIYDNYCGNELNNVYLDRSGDASGVIEVAGLLEKGSKIGVANTGIELTKYYSVMMGSEKPMDYFRSDDGASLPMLQASGEVMLENYQKQVGDRVTNPWSDPEALPDKPGNYTLYNDVTLETVPQVYSEEGEYYIDLGGHTVRPPADVKDSPVIEVGPGVTLILDGEPTGTIQGNPENGAPAIVVDEGAKLILKNVIITGNDNYPGQGGGLYVKGVVELEDPCKITGNRAGQGGGIYIAAPGVVNMKGGEISNNYADEGGGVYIAPGGTLNLSGGKITGNTAIRGGGVYVRGTVRMTGGEISNNYADKGGGGYVAAGGLMEISGGDIYGNRAIRGAGLYVEERANVTMSGGHMYENSAVEAGGGIYTLETVEISAAAVIHRNSIGDPRPETEDFCFANATQLRVMDPLSGDYGGQYITLQRWSDEEFSHIAGTFTTGYNGAGLPGVALETFFTSFEVVYKVENASGEAALTGPFCDKEEVHTNPDGSLSWVDPVLGTGDFAKEILTSGPVFRMYNPNSGEHFYTRSVPERVHLVEVGWNFEDDSCFYTIGLRDDAVPVYRMYNPNGGLHHFTTNWGEAATLKDIGWNFEGVSFLAWPVESTEGVVLYREYNPNDGNHNYTSRKEEHDYLVSLGWHDEAAGWRVLR